MSLSHPFSPLVTIGLFGHSVWWFSLEKLDLGPTFLKKYDLISASSCGLIHVLEGMVHRISEGLSTSALGILVCMLGDFGVLALLLLSRSSRVRLCATPQTVAPQAPPSLGFSRQEHWSSTP